MNKYELHTTAQRALNKLPDKFREAFFSHAHNDDIDDFLGELALAFLEGRTPDQARSAMRRFTEGGQGPRSMVSLESWMENNNKDDIPIFDQEEEERTERAGTIDGIPVSTMEIAAKFGVTRRRAQQLLKQQVEKAKMCGDLFALPLRPEGQGRVENPRRKINGSSIAGQRISAREEEAREEEVMA